MMQKTDRFARRDVPRCRGQKFETVSIGARDTEFIGRGLPGFRAKISHGGKFNEIVANGRSHMVLANNAASDNAQSYRGCHNNYLQGGLRSFLTMASIQRLSTPDAFCLLFDGGKAAIQLAS